MKKQLLRLPPLPVTRERWLNDDQPTPEKILTLSPDSSVSSTSPKSSSRARKTIHAARSAAGAFVACFIPLDYEPISHVSFDSHHTKPASASTNGSSCGIRDGSRHSYNARQTEEQDQDVTFTMEQICKATMNFSPSLKIGQGGFGTVYKGTLHNGKVVAIKRAKKGAYDAHMGVEFQREIEILTQVKHFSLVRLLGFLAEGDERIIIVEYVPNGNLREHLEGKRGDLLSFSVRLDVAVDLAHAITYLHTYTDHPIIHRDIKSSNILLTDNYRVKVADFGFARLAADRNSDATHVSTQVKGTAGYLDPQYMKTRQLTDRSDVYSFGVLLVELFSGRRPIQSRRECKDRVTVIWAIKKLMDGKVSAVLDPRLETNAANILALERIIKLALQCLVPQRDDRPSMQLCAEMLGNIRKDYREESAVQKSSPSTTT